MRKTDTDKKEELFLGLIEENKGIIYKICYAYCQRESDREDLAQEMIYQLWKSGNTFDRDRRFSTWMYRVALNVAISFYRRNSRLPDTDALTGEEENIEDSSANDPIEEKRVALQQSINQLKELERAMMILYLDSKTHAEIAEILGITETNVATRISRIKEKIKQKIAPQNK